MAEQKIGQLLDTLGVTAELGESDMPTDALVIMKVVTDEGRVAIVIGGSESMDWITQKGLLAGATEITQGGFVDGGQ
ncbi:hypothetical protein [Streptomyces spinosisporus]|uniref:Uncharacterized protein n=1 Tax=Streptomyces spinosisporus TaxID=2927582 RepID=A0ABS9XW63_9ACTN|nr:hypothetical protein [Streptomyces spinosisporus]MCI3246320.1 hypothetical protein [Streptomyces spinosisporus]